MGLLQATTQHLGKEVVVAIPVPLVVKGDKKEIGPFQVVQHRLSSCLFGHLITQGTAQALQDAGLQEEGLDLRGLQRKHFLTEVVKHEAVAAAKGSEERGDIASSP